MSTKLVVQKLSLKENEKAIFINAPENYLDTIGEIPKDVKIIQVLEKQMDFIQFFARNKAELEEFLPKLKANLKLTGKLWITYYKGTSKYKTDINRDSINSYAISLGLKGVFIISIDNDWSALRVKIIEK